ncbi:MAG: hypothetical protein JST00_40580 [Deltaproteobacteria bacterium]|nr:hypothetical protein [Deltaproteobacteria bacterium]
MKLAAVSALVLSCLCAAVGGCTADANDTNDPGSAEDDVTSSLALGTYLVTSRPWLGGTYATRLTLKAGKTFEAEISSSGETSFVAGSYVILPARPNNPASPVPSDKPTLYMTPDSGGAPLVFEYDKLAGGEVKLYRSVRTVSFTMKLDPSWHPLPTRTKTIACRGATVDALITLDEAQNRRGTLKLSRKSGADRHDPPSASVAITQTRGSEVPGYLYFEGSSGEQDYYVNMIKADFERGSGAVTAHLTWAEGGQQFGIGGTCAFR